MKRTLIFFVVVIMCLSLFGCGNSPVPPDKPIGTLPPSTIGKGASPEEIVGAPQNQFINYVKNYGIKTYENEMFTGNYSANTAYLFQGVTLGIKNNGKTKTIEVLQKSVSNYISYFFNINSDDEEQNIQMGDLVLVYVYALDSNNYKLKIIQTTLSTANKYTDNLANLIDIYKYSQNIVAQRKEEQQREEEARKEEQRREEEAKKQKEYFEYLASCTEYSYRDVLRNPDVYEGKNIVVKGKVQQVIQSSYYSKRYELRVQIENGGYDDEYYVYYTLPDGGTRILEDDEITIYGTLDGMTSYETVLGVVKHRPVIKAKYVFLPGETIPNIKLPDVYPFCVELLDLSCSSC